MTHKMWVYSGDLKDAPETWSAHVCTETWACFSYLEEEWDLVLRCAWLLCMWLTRFSGLSITWGNPALTMLSTWFALTWKAVANSWYSGGCNFLKKLKSSAFVRGSLGKRGPNPSTGLACEDPQDLALIEAILLGNTEKAWCKNTCARDRNSKDELPVPLKQHN